MVSTSYQGMQSAQAMMQAAASRVARGPVQAIEKAGAVNLPPSPQNLQAQAGNSSAATTTATAATGAQANSATPKLTPPTDANGEALPMHQAADLVKDMVTMKAASYSFMANLKAFKTEETLKGQLLDTTA